MVLEVAKAPVSFLCLRELVRAKLKKIAKERQRAREPPWMTAFEVAKAPVSFSCGRVYWRSALCGFLQAHSLRNYQSPQGGRAF